MVAGHLTTCVLAYPNGAARHVHLETTGHTWVRFAAPSLWAVVPVILLAVGMSAARNGGPRAGVGLALRLAAIQVPTFLLIELLLRDASPPQILGDPAVFVGLVLQPLVAVVAAWLLDQFGEVVRAVVTRLHTPPGRAPRSFPRPALAQSPPRTSLLLHVRRRAPPLAA
jgi:hypothetical protein